MTTEQHAELQAEALKRAELVALSGEIVLYETARDGAPSKLALGMLKAAIEAYRYWVEQVERGRNAG